MSAYNEFDFWSPLLGDYAARLSMVDARGAEHFAIIPKPTGKAWRDAKQTALEKIHHHIESGAEAGEVRV